MRISDDVFEFDNYAIFNTLHNFYLKNILFSIKFASKHVKADIGKTFNMNTILLIKEYIGILEKVTAQRNNRNSKSTRKVILGSV